MVPQKLTEPSELGLSDVLLAKGKCLHRRLLIHDFESRIVLQYLQYRSVSLPKELQPRRDDNSIRAIFGLFAGDCGQEDRLGCLDILQIVDVGTRIVWFERRLDLVCFSLCICDFGVRKFDKLPQNQL